VTVADPVVFGARYSTYTRSLLLALAEKGVAYRLEEVDIFLGATPEYLARQPFGRIPALEHDGFRLYETGAMLRYVDEAFPGPALQPAEVRERARMNQLLGILDSYAYRTLIWDIYVERSEGRAKPEVADEVKIAAAAERAATILDALVDLMGEGPYLAGAGITLADLHAVPILAYFRLTPEGLRLLAARPALGRWWERMAGRDSVRATRFAPERAEAGQ
jgi:glutathione S-transferase